MCLFNMVKQTYGALEIENNDKTDNFVSSESDVDTSFSTSDERDEEVDNQTFCKLLLDPNGFDLILEDEEEIIDSRKQRCANQNETRKKRSHRLKQIVVEENEHRRKELQEIWRNIQFESLVAAQS